MAPEEWRSWADPGTGQGKTRGLHVRAYMDAKGLVEALRGRARIPRDCVALLRVAAEAWLSLWRMGCRFAPTATTMWVPRRFNAAADKLCGWVLDRGGLGWDRRWSDSGGIRGLGVDTLLLAVWSDGGLRGGPRVTERWSPCAWA